MNPAAAGVQIGDLTAQQAQAVSSVYAAVHTYSSTISTLGINVCHGKRGNTDGIAWDHPLQALIGSCQWNDEQTDVAVLDYWMSSLFLRGNLYGQIIRNAFGKPLQIVPIDPDYVFPRRVDGRISYKISNVSGQEPREMDGQTIEAIDMIHVPINWNPKVLRGIGIIAYAQVSIQSGLSLDRFAFNFFTQGATSRIVLEYPGTLDEKQANQIRENFEARISGLENSHKTALIHAGLKLHQLSLAPDECQFLESRKFTVNEVARWFGLPPSKIGGERGSGTYSNREQDAMEFVSHSIRPLCVAMEREFERKLILPSERHKFFLQFDIDALQETDVKTRFYKYEVGRRIGMFSANDCRAMEGLPRRNDPDGDSYSNPNITPTSSMPSNYDDLKGSLNENGKTE